MTLFSEPRGDLGRCRGCGQLVRFIKQRSGKSPPFDIDDAGALVIDPKTMRPRSHFATCPNAADFKGRAKVRR